MNLTCETILDFYEHKNKKILCQIKSLKPKTTCRSLTPELWSVFDKKLEKLISTIDGKCLKFNITPDIVVEVQKSKLSAKNFHICFDSSNGTGEHSNGIIETDFVLECVFDFQEPKTIRSSTDNQEYVPQIETTAEGKTSSPAAYEPYTPSKRLSRACSINGIKSSSLEILEGNEDTYSPKPLCEVAEIDPQITEDIPKYTPAPIKTISSSLSDKPRNEANPSRSNKSLKSNLNDKLESEYVPTSQETALNNVPVYIPTPIDSNQPKANIRKHKRRSKTIDEYPLEFLEYTTDKYRIIQEELEKEKKEIKTYEKRFSIKRSKTIDEMPAVLKHNINRYLPESGKKEFKTFNENLSSIDKVLSAENKLTTSSSKDAINTVFLIEKELQKYANQKEVVENSRRNKETPREKVVGEDIAYLRRSDRSLSKPKRFIEEQPNLLKKPKGKTKTSHKTRELFGTDDEDDDETPTVTAVDEYNAELDSTDISLSYEPYTPTKKKYRVDNIDTVKTPGIDILKAQQKDTICTEILSEATKDDSTASEEIPNTPVSIKAKTRRGSRESNKSNRSDLLGEVIVETCDELESSKKVETSKIKTKENKSIEEISRRKQRKRCQTLDEMPILRKEDIPLDKCKKLKELEDNRSSFKHCHYEHKKLKKRSQSTEELTKFKKIITEENRSKPLETISESSTNLFKKNKNASNDNISNSKSKANTEKHDEYFSSSSCDDDLNIPLIKLKNSNSCKKTSDDEFEDTSTLNKNIKLKKTDDNSNNLNISISSATAESATDTSPTRIKRGRKQKVNISSSSTITSLRRSERSPNKPLRYTVDISEMNKKRKSKKQKSSPTNKDLFGTDYDEDDDDFENNNDAKIGKNKNITKSSPSIFETPVTQKMNKSASSSSSAKKKRKRDRSSECEQEKRDISKWLSKKKSTPTKKEGTKITSKEHKSKTSSKKDKKQKSDANTADSRSNSPTPVFEMPSKEELELIRKKSELAQKENAKLKAELEKLSTGPPKEVEFLSLQKLTVEEILNTFSTYKSDLDEIYESNCKRDYIKSHDGINHCFIIRLLQHNVQMKMLEKLANVYSNTSQATLLANALLPEWVIRVYMKQFKFTRQEAIEQIKAQEEFQLHKEEQSDNSFRFD